MKNNLRNVRLQLNVSQARLSQLTGQDIPTIQAIEAGMDCSEKIKDRICLVLGVWRENIFPE